MAKHDFFAARCVRCSARRPRGHDQGAAPAVACAPSAETKRVHQGSSLHQGSSDFETLEIELSNRLLVTSEISPLFCAKCEKTLGQV